MSPRPILIAVALLWAGAAGLQAQATTPATTLRGRVEVIGDGTAGNKRHGTIPGTVVWLTPLASNGGEGPALPPAATASAPPSLRLMQKNKSFDPHILVVPA